MAHKPQVYSAASQALHPGIVARTMLRNLAASRYVGYRLALRDIKSSYSRTAFGMFWDLVDPLVLALVFYTMMQARVLNAGDLAMPYSVYVVFGFLLYQTFAEAATQTTGIFKHSGALLNQTKTLPEALLAAIFLRCGFMSLFRVVVMVGFALATGSFSVPGLLGFAVAFPLLIVAGMAIGVFLAPFDAIYSDVGRALSMILVPLRYASPTLFVFPATPAWQWLYTLNPVAPLIDNLRLVATTGTMSHPGLVAAHLGLFCVVGLLGWFVYHVSVPVLAERC